MRAPSCCRRPRLPDPICRCLAACPPTLVVEILSPSTRERDETVKARRYAALGIPHYWVVDPDALRIAFYTAEGPSYVVAADAEGDTTVEAPGWCPSRAT